MQACLGQIRGGVAHLKTHAHEAFGIRRALPAQRLVQVQDGVTSTTVAALWLPIAALAVLQASRAFSNRSQQPDTDGSKADIAYKVKSYTLWPVADDVESERVRIPVGDMRNLHTETFLFDKQLQGPSEIVVVSMPRPLGVVMEEVAGQDKKVVVCDVIPGTAAAQRLQLTRFDKKHRASAVLPGDLLRAVTCTTIVYQSRKGLQIGLGRLPERHRVVFGADGQPWRKVRAALKAGLVQDGPVTLVLERSVLVQK